MPAQYNPNTATHVALDLTKIALEQHLIQNSTDPKKAAKNVVDYYNVIYDSLVIGGNSQSAQ